MKTNENEQVATPNREQVKAILDMFRTDEKRLDEITSAQRSLGNAALSFAYTSEEVAALALASMPPTDKEVVQFAAMSVANIMLDLSELVAKRNAKIPRVDNEIIYEKLQLIEMLAFFSALSLFSNIQFDRHEGLQERVKALSDALYAIAYKTGK